MSPGGDPPPPGATLVAVADRVDFPSIDALPDGGRTRHMRLGPVVAQGVLVGHGDYNTNPGPLDVVAVDAEGTVTTLLSDVPTEELDGWRVLDGAVYAPSLDSHEPSGGFIVTNQGGTWRTVAAEVAGVPVLEHGFAVDMTAEGTLLICGSRQLTEAEGRPPGTDRTGAIVWATDNLEDWTEELLHTAGATSAVNRFTTFDRIDGDLAVRTFDHSGTYTRGVGWTLGGYVTTVDPVEQTIWIGAQGHIIDAVDGDLYNLPGDGSGWTVSRASDGTVYVCDGTVIYLLILPN